MGWVQAAAALLGTVRIKVTAPRRVFIGIAPESDVQAYLDDVARAEGSQFDARSANFLVHQGGPPSSPPAEQRFWGASTTGSAGTTLSWTPQAGNWRASRRL